MTDSVIEDGSVLHPDRHSETHAVVEPELGLLRNYEEARRLGQTIVSVASERETNGLTPYLAIDKLPEAYRAAVASKEADGSLTQDDIDRARRASLGLAIEATAQVSEATIRGPQVTEEVESLEHLHRALRDGQELRQQGLKIDRADVFSLTKEAVARRLGKPAEQVAMGDDALSAWLDEHYRNADARMAKGIEALKTYLNTSDH